ncbi:hypothetical protein UG55_1001120 [Frankia sp. EI5c]|nr:hypothetical protein UG55_1001120 [Frankia sp. EI5c]
MMAVIQLAAMQHAARQPRGRSVQWTVSNGDTTTEVAYEELKATLLQTHTFPKSTQATTKLRLDFQGRVRPSGPRSPRPINFSLDFLDVPGRFFRDTGAGGGDARNGTHGDGIGIGFGDRLPAAGRGGRGDGDDGDGDDLRFDDDPGPDTPAGPSPGARLAAQAELIDYLVSCDGIVLLVDPIREREDRDNLAYFDAMINRVFRRVHAAGGTQGGALPHHLSVCITKFDDPRVLGVALDAAQLAELAARPGPPRLDDKVASRYLEQLCASSPSAAYLRGTIDGLFQKDRVRYYATSSIGFHVGQDGRFSPADYANVVMTGGQARVRGMVRPMNVLEPIVSLVTRITQTASGSAP